MSKALVIKNANFGENRLATVTLIDPIPCASITLNKTTVSLTEIGATDTLIATVTPINTTDAVVWATSDSNVATVSNGTVTAVGCGSATITATCGACAATCTITIVHTVNFAYALNSYLGKSDSKTMLDSGDLDNYAIGFMATGGPRRISYNYRNLERYPIFIPIGATKITVECTNFRPYGYWLDSKQDGGGVSTVAYALPKQAFGTQLTETGSRTALIPEKTGDYASMDSVALVFRYMNGTISDSAMEEITVTFTA